MGERKALDGQASLLMVLMCLILGLQQVVLKLAASDISPLMQIAIRSGLAALLVFPLIQLQQGTRLFDSEYVRPACWIALLFAGEFLFVAEALRYTSASHTAMLLYTAPIFTAIGLHLKIPAERLSKIQWCGVLLAFIGIMVTFLGRSEPSVGSLETVLWGDFLALLAGVCWAMTTITLKLSHLSEVHPTQTLFYQLLGSFILLFPLAFITGQADIQWSLTTFASLGFHTIVVSFLCLMLWFWLLRHYLASHLGVFSFLTPLFGMLFGVWILNERLEFSFIIGTVLVLSGMAIVSMRGWLARSRSN